MPKKPVKKKQTRSTSKKAKNEQSVLFLVYGAIAVSVALIGALNVGIVGEFLQNCVRFIVGDLVLPVFALIIILAIYFMVKKSFKGLLNRYMISSIVLFLVVLIFITSLNDQKLDGKAVLDSYIENAGLHFNGTFGAYGGLLGALLYAGLSTLFGRVGTFVVLLCIVFIILLLTLSHEGRVRLKELIIAPFKALKTRRENRSDTKNIEDDVEIQEVVYDEEIPQEEDYADLLDDPIDMNTSDGYVEMESSNNVFMNIDDILDDDKKDTSIQVDDVKTTSNKVEDTSSVPYVHELTKYRLPRINLLQPTSKSTKTSGNSNAANEAGKKLVHILEQFGVNVTLVATHIGPSVTKFELRPEVGVRVNKISNLQQDIKMGLAAKEIRIEAPIPGKSTVGIEIPNIDKTLVGMRDLIRQIPASEESKKLLFALGKDLMGNCVYGDMEKLTHLLIAGATGSGKSVCVNAIITSIIMRARPDEVKLLLIDPKKVEFTQFSNIPHLIAPVITSAEEASRALEVIVKMMDDRYDIFSKIGVRNISSYNELVDRNPGEMKKLPKIVVIIDELADLMLVAAKDVEARIQRITQLARAAGIHLIVATQRPSVDVITGLIKANIPSRIAFAVSSAVDSRTILDQQGAEKLLGNGDMLYIPRGENSPVRVQGCYVSDEEVVAVANECSRQAKPAFEDIFVNLAQLDANGGSVSESSDPLYDDVRQFVIESKKASTSFIQRKFSIGYARAARLIDQLEASGVIGPSNGSKPREVYVRNDNPDTE